MSCNDTRTNWSDLPFFEDDSFVVFTNTSQPLTVGSCKYTICVIIGYIWDNRYFFC